MASAPTYLEPTQEAGREFFTRGITGRVVMLNLLRFRATADYSATPHLAPKSPITGEDAYRLYMEHTRPHLKNAGGEIRFLGRGGKFLAFYIDPEWFYRRRGVPRGQPIFASATVPITATTT